MAVAPKLQDMRVLGRASTSQVIAAYRYDFKLQAAGKPWPEPHAFQDTQSLTIARLSQVILSGRPVFLPLEATWDVCEFPRATFLARTRSFWGPEQWTMPIVDMVNAYGVTYTPSEDVNQRVRELRNAARTSTLEFGVLAGVALAQSGRLDNECSIGLLEGNHRVVAAALEGKLPATITMLVASKPFELGVAVLNGFGWPYRRD
jgi:hypothetical protein